MEGKDSGDGKQNTADMTQFVSSSDLVVPVLQCLIESYIRHFSNALDEMGERISELEQSINDLRAEMGAEGTPPPAAPPKNTDDE
ncbi:hypothetical protein R6Q59_020406 [Mikania micrantha]|uniref:Uncharacterized protein n=1 Tax=Mikania micrantha TaxID=192012 RepID=A0A5N6MCQ1_9ASTR|nr:hypothetical protein E3N88_33707 [Mikania micrantha]